MLQCPILLSLLQVSKECLCDKKKMVPIIKTPLPPPNWLKWLSWMSPPGRKRRRWKGERRERQQWRWQRSNIKPRGAFCLPRQRRQVDLWSLLWLLSLSFSKVMRVILISSPKKPGWQLIYFCIISFLSHAWVFQYLLFRGQIAWDFSEKVFCQYWTSIFLLEMCLIVCTVFIESKEIYLNLTCFFFQMILSLMWTKVAEEKEATMFQS